MQVGWGGGFGVWVWCGGVGVSDEGVNASQ